jgi:hypothetical protein
MHNVTIFCFTSLCGIAYYWRPDISIHLPVAAYAPGRAIDAHWPSRRPANGKGSAWLLTLIGVVEPAVVPSQPSKPNLKLNLVLGVLVGLVGGVGLALLFENLDPALHSSDDLVSVVTVPLLGRIPRFKTRNRSRSGEIALGNGFSPSVTEAFLGLSVNVLSLNSGACPKTLLISSAEPRAGKSTVLVHLGAALAQAGRQVIVVDGDLRNPCLHHLLGLSRVPGLADVVLDPSMLDYTLRETQIRGLRALTAGSPQTNPVGFWHLPGVSEVIGKLAEATDIVLWDSPPSWSLRTPLCLLECWMVCCWWSRTTNLRSSRSIWRWRNWARLERSQWAQSTTGPAKIPWITTTTPITAPSRQKGQRTGPGRRIRKACRM